MGRQYGTRAACQARQRLAKGGGGGCLARGGGGGVSD